MVITKIKSWGLLIVAFIVVGFLGFVWGRYAASPDVKAQEEWLDSSTDSGDAESRFREKNLELLGQVMLLKKMLGEIESDLVLMAPVGSMPMARGRLVWDGVRLEGFLHAVQLKDNTTETGKWAVEVVKEGEVVARCPLPAPDADYLLQTVFRPDGRVLGWDRFLVVRTRPDGEREVILAGAR